MRLSSRKFFAALLMAGTALYTGCSSDSPTQPKTNPGGSGGLNVIMSTSNANPKAGDCTLVEAFATINGAPVPDGTSIVFTTLGGFFAQNNGVNISLVSSGGAAAVTLCSSNAGTAKVTGTVSLNGKQASKSITITFASNGIPQCPLISQCAVPSSGPVTGGTTVDIRGCGFGTVPGNVRVFFKSGSISHIAPITGITDADITVLTPAFPELDPVAATPVDVLVILGSGFTLTTPSCFTYTGTNVQPTVNAILPSEGTKLGGTRATIFGSGFTAPLQVFFTVQAPTVGSAPSVLQAIVDSVTFNQIVVETPALSPALGASSATTAQVTVTNVASGLTSNAVFYNYVSPLAIFAVTPDHGTSTTPITITGTGFTAPLVVTIGGTQVEVVSVTATQIVVLATPVGGGNACGIGGTVAVTLLSNGETAVSASSFRNTSQPNGLTLAPASLPPNATTAVTLSGQNIFPSGSPGTLPTITASGGTVSIVSGSASDNGVTQSIGLNITSTCVTPITLTVTNSASGCSGTTTATVGPITPPTATFTTTAGAALSGQLTFDASASTGTGTLTYAWTFTGGAPPTATGAVVGPITFTSACSTCSASLTVTDACGATATLSSAVSPP